MLTKKHKEKKSTTTMEMITHTTTDIQEETLKNVLRNVPMILTDGKTEAFILVKDLNEELENFILTGRVSSAEISVFPNEYEQELIKQWRLAGFTHTYHSQPFEYMNHRVTIKYMQVCNPETDVKISLIPWFLSPGRPYPIFVYVYAIWHYNTSEQKSMELSAIAVRKIFRIDSFNKSTISRSIKVMEQLISGFQMDKPLSVSEPDVLSTALIINRVPELLNNKQTIESLVEAFGPNVAYLPTPIRGADAISDAFSLIPNELSRVIKSDPIRKQSRDLRKRPNRKKKKKYRSVQRKLNFLESRQIEQIRLAFIAACKSSILDAAITFHRFLL